ncbi:MAG: DUF3501 family protein [Gammaproteobacteria bacterium]|nr:DUF3501 family protein [Gammaproteobacteria bacterium]
MEKLTRQDLYTLEAYASLRAEFRARVMAHKKDRQVVIGSHARLYFEDRMTIQYQVQEMLRVERIFEEAGILAELEAYNPLIPDGGNLKATFMLEYADIGERQQALARMVGIEDRVWLKVAGFNPVWAIADEDMERETTEKTSSVHFLRFELTPAMIGAVKQGAGIGMGIDHAAYRDSVEAVADNVRRALAADLG